MPAPLWRRTHGSASFCNHEDLEFPLVVACASDVLGVDGWRPPEGAVSAETRYLILADVPTPALGRLISIFDVRRPEQRMHITQDVQSITRLLIAQLRDVPFEGIVDAYLLAGTLVLLLGDFTMRSFPIEQIPFLQGQNHQSAAAFEIDGDGSYLYWPAADLHIGVSQLLQAVDPTYLADVEIRRLPASAAIGKSIAKMREDRSLRQRDIPGLSERHVRRIEQGVSQLTSDAAQKLATAFHMDMEVFLGSVAVAAASAADSGVVVEEPQGVGVGRREPQ